MQEGKQFEISRQYVDAKAKYTEAARLNVAFSAEEGSPETLLTRVNVAAQRRINGLIDEARSCIERGDKVAATATLDEADQLAMGMGLDTSNILDVRLVLKPPAPVIRTVRRSPAAKATVIGDEVPLPVIHNGRKNDLPADPIGVTTTAGEESPFETIPSVKPRVNIIKKIPTSKVEDLPPLPPVPDVEVQADATKPPKPSDPATKAPSSFEKGDMLLNTARMELKKGDPETARKIAVDLINGKYDSDLKDEAQTLLKSIDTYEAGRKMDTARRAFENGMKAYQMSHFAQALAIFKQIDGTLLPSESRKNLNDMIVVASAKAKEMDDATAARTGEKLPTAPKTPAGVPDLPLTGPSPIVRTGQDNLLKQQEALGLVEFQRLRSKALKVESEATNRFGRGETDAAIIDMMNFIAEVKASNLDVTKQNLLVRPIAARMDRLKILKHQTDFLTTESRDRRNFKAGMTQEALDKQGRQKEVAELISSSHKLMEEHKYKEAYVQLQKAQTIEPDDASLNANVSMAERLWRLTQVQSADKSQEKPELEDDEPVARVSGRGRQGSSAVPEG